MHGNNKASWSCLLCLIITWSSSLVDSAGHGLEILTDFSNAKWMGHYASVQYRCDVISLTRLKCTCIYLSLHCYVYFIFQSDTMQVIYSYHDVDPNVTSGLVHYHGDSRRGSKYVHLMEKMVEPVLNENITLYTIDFTNYKVSSYRSDCLKVVYGYFVFTVQFPVTWQSVCHVTGKHTIH